MKGGPNWALRILLAELRLGNLVEETNYDSRNGRKKKGDTFIFGQMRVRGANV